MADSQRLMSSKRCRSHWTKLVWVTCSHRPRANKCYMLLTLAVDVHVVTCLEGASKHENRLTQQVLPTPTHTSSFRCRTARLGSKPVLKATSVRPSASVAIQQSHNRTSEQKHLCLRIPRYYYSNLMQNHTLIIQMNL